MMNFSDFAVCLLTGFSVPYLLSSMVPAVRSHVADGVAVEAQAGDLFTRWLIAFACGPALLAQRLLSGLALDREEPVDIALGFVAALGWAVLYGFVVLDLVQRLSH